MPRSRRARPTRSGRRRPSTKQRRRATPSLLILECDPEKLPAQPTSFAADLESIARVFVPHARTARVRAETVSQLLAELGRLKIQSNRFEMITIVAHSNVSVVGLTRDRAVSWEALGQWLAPFSPRVVLLVACEAGRWVAARTLFEGVPSLKEVYGSPVLINDLQAAGIKLLVPYLLSGKRPTAKGVRMGRLVNFLLTQGIVLRRTRRDYREPAVLQEMAWTAGEELLKMGLRRLGLV